MPVIDLNWVPCLRPDIEYLTAEDGLPPALWDPVLRRRVELGRVAHEVVAGMDGRRALGEVLDQAVSRGGASAEMAEQSVRTLLLLNLLSGAGADIIARVRRVRDGERPGLRVLPETRFTCQASGDCCQSYSFGPLEPGDVARLHALGDALRAAFPQLGDGPYLEERPQDSGEVHRYLKSVDERCVFLLPDHRCGIHAHFGAAAKPDMCRDYPLHIVPTALGLRVFDRGECSRYADSARCGPPIAEQPERMLRLLPVDFDHDKGLDHPAVLLDAHTPCDYGHFVPLQEALCDLLGAGIGSAGQTLCAAGRLLQAFQGALAECPLRAGEPDRTVAEVLGTAPAVLYAPPDQATRQAGLEAIAEIAGDLLREVGFRIAAAENLLQPLTSLMNVRQFAAVIHTVRLLAADRAGLMDYELPEPFAAVARTRAGDPELDQVMRLSLRQQLFGRLLIESRPAAGLLRIAFAYLVAMIGAKSQAAQAGRDAVTLADFNFGHMIAWRVLRQQGAVSVFVAHEARAGAVAAACASLVD
jgi:Fe-S-cluster containining protein